MMDMDFPGRVIEFLPDATFAIDTDGRVVVWNRAMEELTGVSAAEMLGKGNFEYAIPFYGERGPILIDLVLRSDSAIEETYTDVRRSEGCLIAEITDARPRGEQVILWGKAAPLFDGDGERVGAIESIRDITDRRRTEEALRSAQQRLREVHRLARIGTWGWDTRTDTITWSEELCRIVGWDPSRPPPPYADLSRIYTPESWERLDAAVRRALETGEPYDLELELVRTDGERRWQKAVGGVRRDEQGTITGLHGTVQEITDRKRAEEALRRSEELFREVFEHSFDYLGVLTPDGTLIRANSTALDVINAEAESVLGRPFWETPWWTHSTDEQERLTDAIRRAADGEIVRYETTHNTGDSGIIDVDFSIKPVRDESGSVIYLIPEGRNITDRKQMEEALRRSEERFHAIIEDQTEFICRFLPDGTHLFVNEAYASYFGRDREELMGSVFRPAIHPDDRERVRAFFASLSPDHPVGSIEHRIIMPGGEIRWQWWNDRAIFDDDRNVVEYQSVGRDITDRKQAEKALEESQRKLEEAMDLAHMAYWEFDIARGIFTFNDRFYALYATTAEREGGYQMPAEVYAREFVHPDDRHVVADEVKKARETGDPHFLSRIEHRIIRRDGEVRSIVVRIRVTLDAHGHPVTTHGVNQDITERREAEEKLQWEKDLFESTFESLKDAAFVLGRDPVVIRMANEAAEEIFGYSRDEMVGRTTGFLHVDEAALGRFHGHVYPFLERGESIPRFRFTMKRKDGTVFPTEHAMAPLYGPEGAHTGWISLVRDITPEVEAERREEQAMRQLEENMEQLATLNDHIRNPLAVIVGLVDMDCPGIIGAVMEQAERIDDIITLLDAGWIRSEKTWEFLHRHYRLGDETPVLQGSDTEEMG